MDALPTIRHVMISLTPVTAKLPSPASHIPRTNSGTNLEAATFSVEVVDEHTTAGSCLAGPDLKGPEGGGLDVDKHGTTRIQEVPFAAFEFGEGGKWAARSGSQVVSVPEIVRRLQSSGRSSDISVFVSAAISQKRRPKHFALKSIFANRYHG